MVRFIGKSDETTTIKGKPIPVGFKIWVVAQQGFFIYCLWHIKDSEHGVICVEITPRKTSTQGRPSKRRRGPAKTAGKTDTEEEPASLNSTQAVIITLANMLPKATYHVFIDNLFSSLNLFRSLRNHGHGATGTARKNCGIHQELLQDKTDDGKVKKSYKYNQIKVITTPDNKIRD